MTEPSAPRPPLRFCVPSITCGSCAATIEGRLKQDPAGRFTAVAVSILHCEVAVTIHPDCQTPDSALLEEIREILDGVGFSLAAEEKVLTAVMELDQANPVANPAKIVDPTKIKPNQSIRRLVVKGVIGTLIGVTLLALAASGVGLPFALMCAITVLGGALTLYLGWDIYRSAILALIKTKKLNMDSLFTVSTVTALGVSLAALFVPWLSMMLDAALLILGFRQLGLAMEESVRRKIVKGLSFCDRAPSTVLKIKEGKEIVTSVKDIQIGDVIKILPGQMLPLDGICKHEVMIRRDTYGDREPVLIKQEEALVAGIYATHESLTVRVTHIFDQSYLARRDDYIKKIECNKSKLEDWTDKISRYFIPAVFVVAAISGLMLGLLFTPALAIQCVIALLVAVCPCTLGFIVPLVVNIGIRRGQEHGVNFKGGKSFQDLSAVTAIVFDLNGTLTEGKKKIHQVVLSGDAPDRMQIMDFLYLLEQEAASKHVVAHAVHEYAKEEILKSNRALPDQALMSKGQSERAGVRALIGSAWYTLGDATFMKHHHIPCQLPATVDASSMTQVIFLAKEGEVIAYLYSTDPLRPYAKEAVQAFQRSGKLVAICTGADRETAMRYASALKIPEDNVYYACTPHPDVTCPDQMTKTSVIESLKDRGYRVAFVGDGTNDEPAMKASLCSLAIVPTDEMADLQTAKNACVQFQGPTLKPLLDAFTISKQTMRNLRLSLGVSLTYNMMTVLLTCGLLIGVGFAINPALGALLMVVQAGILLGVAYYYRRKALPVFEGMCPVIASTAISSTSTMASERMVSPPGPSPIPSVTGSHEPPLLQPAVLRPDNAKTGPEVGIFSSFSLS
jgi:Cu2+-exporting ATPase